MNENIKKDSIHNIRWNNNNNNGERVLNMKTKFDDEKILLSKESYYDNFSYLFEEILFIGYNARQIKSIMDPIDNLYNQLYPKDICDFIKDLNLNPIPIHEKPAILNRIGSSYDKTMIDNDLLINCIFPSEQFISSSKYNQSLSVIFSITITTNNKKTMKYYYYSCIYYNCIIIQKTSFYYPSAITIVSHYPYYLNYRDLVEFLHTMKPTVPKEYYLYHLIDLPSPLNSNYIFDYFSAGDNLSQYLYFKKLPGYPLLQLNFSEIFKYISVNIFIKIFIFTFLEIQVYFFSKNLEVLNAILHIFGELNYPLNNVPYYNQLVSVSAADFLNGTSPFVIKPYSCMLGINSSYTSVIAKSIKYQCLIVDIDEKLCFFNPQNLFTKIPIHNSNTTKLIDLIDKSIEDKNSNNYIIKAIFVLNQELCSAYQKEAKKNEQKNENNNLGFFPKLQQKQYFEKTSRTIQEYFYHFIVKILSHYVLESAVTLSKSLSLNINMNINPITTNQTIETIFETNFKESTKYALFFEEFLYNNKKINKRIQLSFLEEFIHTKISSNHLSSVFDSIDLYYKIPCKEWPKVDMQAYYDLTKRDYKSTNEKNILDLLLFDIKYKSGKKSKQLSTLDYLKIQQYLSLSQKNIINPNLFNDQISLHKNSNFIGNIHKSIFNSMIDQKQISINQLLISSFILFLGLSKMFRIKDFPISSANDLIMSIILTTPPLINQRRIIITLIQIIITIIKENSKSNINSDNERIYLIQMITIFFDLKLIPTIELTHWIQNAFLQGYFNETEIDSLRLSDWKHNQTNLLFKINPDMINTNFQSCLQLNEKDIKKDQNYSIELSHLANNFKNEGFFQDMTFNTDITQIQNPKNDSIFQRNHPNNYYWKIIIDHNSIVTPIYLPRTLYNTIFDLSNQFIKDPNFKSNKVFLQDLCSSLLFYITNIDDFFNYLNQNVKITLSNSRIAELKERMIEYLYLILLRL